MAHELGALRGFSALAQKPAGKSDRDRGSLWGGAPAPLQMAERRGAQKATGRGKAAGVALAYPARETGQGRALNAPHAAWNTARHCVASIRAHFKAGMMLNVYLYYKNKIRLKSL